MGLMQTISSTDLLISRYAGATRACFALTVKRARAKTLAAKIMLDRLLVDVRATMEVSHV